MLAPKRKMAVSLEFDISDGEEAMFSVQVISPDVLDITGPSYCTIHSEDCKTVIASAFLVIASTSDGQCKRSVAIPSALLVKAPAMGDILDLRAL